MPKPDECDEDSCTSDACQVSRAVCEDAGCVWDDGECRFPRTTGNGGAAPPSTRPSGCFTRWNCTEWSECTPAGVQSRICYDTGTCNEPEKVEYQQCIYIPPSEEEEIPIEEPTPEEEEPEEPEKEFQWMWVILIFIIAGGFGVVFYEIERSRGHLEKEKTMHHKEVHPNTYANLENYIRRTLEMGYTRPQVRQALIKEGWSPQILNKIFPRV